MIASTSLRTQNIVLDTDSYKLTHYRQYPPNTTEVYSYMESRGGFFPATMFFGLQYYLKEYLTGVRVTPEMLDEAEELISAHMNDDKIFNRVGWQHIIDAHGGKLPVEICAVPEGTRVENSNVLMTIRNTDPKCYWLPNYLETLLLKTWYPTTVATLSYEIKKLILRYLELTGDPGLIPFKLHDFGYRGVSSEETAWIGAGAHLINFRGTDTLAGIRMLRTFYNTKDMPGFSIPAAEHSTVTAWTQAREEDAYKNMLTQFPNGLVAVVSDSYDIFHACEEIWGNKLREMVLARNGTVVVRPDSGDPATTVKRVVNILGQRFGFSENQKGYKVLNPKIRVIQGDGVNYHSIGDILRTLSEDGWSADNIAFGMGGALLQNLTRDTQNFAFKASLAVVGGVDVPVFKKPKTDSGKDSKKGRLALVWNGEKFVTQEVARNVITAFNKLIPVFRDGDLLREYSLKEVIASSERVDYGDAMTMSLR